MAQALAGLDGVTNVEAIDVSGSKQFAEKYIVTFEQLLDHKEPSVGPGEATHQPRRIPSPREHGQAIVHVFAERGGEQLAAHGMLAHLHVVALL